MSAIKYFILVLILLDVLFLIMLGKNMHWQKVKQKCGKVVSAKINNWNAFMGEPWCYIVKYERYTLNIEYQLDNETICINLMTHRRFAKKYRDNRDVQIVIIPNSNKILFAEENRIVDNAIYTIFIFVITFFLVFLLMIT